MECTYARRGKKRNQYKDCWVGDKKEKGKMNMCNGDGDGDGVMTYDLEVRKSTA